MSMNTLFLSFSPDEQLPVEGDTVTMEGLAKWRVTIKRILATSKNNATGETILEVKASRELVELGGAA